MDGLTYGFWIGFNYAQTSCKSSRRNMSLAKANAEAIDSYVAQDRKASRLAGPMQTQLVHTKVSPLKIIPKSHQPRKWRVIVDISSPLSARVNEGIDRDACALSYSRDVAAQHILFPGTGILLAKLDIQSAHRHIPVHPSNRHFVGIRWNGEVYSIYRRAMHFGLRSAPKIFSAVADTLLWIILNRGVRTGAVVNITLAKKNASNLGLKRENHSRSGNRDDMM